jgi:hypothetical protein
LFLRFHDIHKLAKCQFEAFFFIVVSFQIRITIELVASERFQSFLFVLGTAGAITSLLHVGWRDTSTFGIPLQQKQWGFSMGMKHLCLLVSSFFFVQKGHSIFM